MMNPYVYAYVIIGQTAYSILLLVVVSALLWRLGHGKDTLVAQKLSPGAGGKE